MFGQVMEGTQFYGLFGMILVRQIFCWVGVEEHLTFRGAAYLGVFVMIAVSLWYAFFLT